MHWWTHKSFEEIATHVQMDIEFIDFKHYNEKRKNLLLAHFFGKKEHAPTAILTTEGEPNIQASPQLSPARKIMHAFFVDFPVARIISNSIYALFFKQYPTLAVMLSKK